MQYFYENFSNFFVKIDIIHKNKRKDRRRSAKQKNRNRVPVLSLAAGEGFEPSQTESESVVLPLHNPAIFTCARLKAKVIIPTSQALVKPLGKNFSGAETL